MLSTDCFSLSIAESLLSVRKASEATDLRSRHDPPRFQCFTDSGCRHLHFERMLCFPGSRETLDILTAGSQP